jgi:hypothetical protein
MNPLNRRLVGLQAGQDKIAKRKIAASAENHAKVTETELP